MSLDVDEHAVGRLRPELDLDAELVLGLGERTQLDEGAPAKEGGQRSVKGQLKVTIEVITHH